MASLKRPEPVFSLPFLAARLRNDLEVPTAATLTVALSGGLDSTVLLHALASLRQNYSLGLSAIHIDHGLHPDSAKWAEHCELYCRKLGLPLRVKRVVVDRARGEGLEAAARLARYQAIAAMLSPGATLVTAHHADDQAETVLLRLLRGAGVAGLAGMSRQRQMSGLTVLRPLLDVPRAALEDYARQNSLRWIDDPSNSNCELRRNFLRREILPRLEKHWPDSRYRITQAAHHASEAQGILDELAARDLDKFRPGTSDSEINVTGLEALSDARQRNLLRYWLRSQAFSMPDTRQLREIQSLARHTTRSRHACVRCGNYEVWRYRKMLKAIPVLPVPSRALDVEWNPLSLIEIEGVGQLRTETVTGHGLAINRLQGNYLRVRLRQGGEQLQLPGRRHHHQLKKLLQAAGIPPWERARLPLLFDGQELVAVADRWVCRDFASASAEPGLRIVWTPFPASSNRS